MYIKNGMGVKQPRHCYIRLWLTLSTFRVQFRADHNKGIKNVKNDNMKLIQLEVHTLYWTVSSMSLSFCISYKRSTRT